MSGRKHNDGLEAKRHHGRQAGAADHQNPPIATTGDETVKQPRVIAALRRVKTEFSRLPTYGGDVEMDHKGVTDFPEHQPKPLGVKPTRGWKPLFF